MSFVALGWSAAPVGQIVSLFRSSCLFDDIPFMLRAGASNMTSRQLKRGRPAGRGQDDIEGQQHLTLRRAESDRD
jgi:hypothetical protein